jgi:hypothetical protein
MKPSIRITETPVTGLKPSIRAKALIGAACIIVVALENYFSRYLHFSNLVFGSNRAVLATDSKVYTRDAFSKACEFRIPTQVVCRAIDRVVYRSSASLRHSKARANKRLWGTEMLK